MWCIGQRVQAALHATIIRNGKVCSALSFLFWDRQRLMKYPADQLTKNGSLVGVAAASMVVITIRTECFLIPICRLPRESLETFGCVRRIFRNHF